MNFLIMDFIFIQYSEYHLLKYQQMTLAMMTINSSKAVGEFFGETIENATKQTVIMGVDMIDFSVSIEKEFVYRG